MTDVRINLPDGIRFGSPVSELDSISDALSGAEICDRPHDLKWRPSAPMVGHDD